jgi:hypothetical protein
MTGRNLACWPMLMIFLSPRRPVGLLPVVGKDQKREELQYNRCAAG